MNERRWGYGPVAVVLCAVLALVVGCDGETGGDDPVDSTPDVGTDAPTETPDGGVDTETSMPNIDGWDALPDMNPDPNIVEVEMWAEYSRIDIGLGEPLDVLTYNGQFPGPLLQANVGDRVIVHFENDLNEPTTIH